MRNFLAVAGALAVANLVWWSTVDGNAEQAWWLSTVGLVDDFVVGLVLLVRGLWPR